MKPCRPAYSFHNDLPLSSNIDEFVSSVENVTHSSNLDNPEGVLDAMMQAIVCQVGQLSSDNLFKSTQKKEANSPQDAGSYTPSFEYFLCFCSQVYPLEHIKNGFKSPKIDSLQGFHPWTPQEGSQRPQPNPICFKDD